jgi:hypothetical protein
MGLAGRLEAGRYQLVAAVWAKKGLCGFVTPDNENLMAFGRDQNLLSIHWHML